MDWPVLWDNRLPPGRASRKDLGAAGNRLREEGRYPVQP